MPTASSQRRRSLAPPRLMGAVDTIHPLSLLLLVVVVFLLFPGSSSSSSSFTAQAQTLRPTVYALDQGQNEFCETAQETTITPVAGPRLYRGLPCNFGTSGGTWSFVSTTTDGGEGGGGVQEEIITGIQGCLPASRAQPSSTSSPLPNDTLWCPVQLNADNEFEQDVSVAWGVCSCEDCRVMPNAEPSGLVSSGICAFNANNWSYKFANGTLVRGLTSCVDLNQYPPQGYPQMFEGQASLSNLWCPTALSEAGVYTQVPECDEYECPPTPWGVCECAAPIEQTPTKLPTSAPIRQPTSAPTLMSTRAPTAPTPAGENSQGQYCQIQSSVQEGVLQSGNCNFGPFDEWSYRGEDDITYSGLDSCATAGDFPPMVLDGPAPAPDALWCPGRLGLDGSDTYVMLDPNLFSEWGICACAACRIVDSGLAGVPLTQGLCNLGTDAKTWSYRFPNGTVREFSSQTRAVSVRDYPPSTLALPDGLSSTAMWCPGPLALAANTLLYNPALAQSQNNWGLAECMQQPDSLAPTTAETRAPTLPAGATARPTTKSPTVWPTTRAPTTKKPTVRPTTLKPTLKPTKAPTLAPQTVCMITSTPPGTTAEEDSLCGFSWTSRTWQYVDDADSALAAAPVTLNQCVRAMYYPPFGTTSESKFFWCPSASALVNNNTYHTKALSGGVDRLAWGECDCERCDIIDTGRSEQDVFAQTSGPCHFGTTGEWYFVDQTGERSGPLVGSTLIGLHTPFGSGGLGGATKWCPAQGGLDAANTFYFSGSRTTDMLAWGACDCESVLDLEYETEVPTKLPTKLPTTRAPSSKAPTKTPTTAPTKAPTKLPTNAPTKTPTMPTIAPTGTASPTVATTQPTLVPTTRQPTTLPSKAPTTRGPVPFGPDTPSPTTASPGSTPAPTSPTTNFPTLKPTTGSPTKFPTTLAPTKAPTRYPTFAPVPTVRPTLAPIVLRTPTQSPTCCHIVEGGPPAVSGGCNFGTGGVWSYKSPGISDSGLTGCVSVDDYPPNGIDPELLDTGAKWCPATEGGLNAQNEYDYNNQWGICDCPCMPTPAPTTARPTPAGGTPRLALFIQADHSGSIKDANSLCKEQTRDPVTGKAFNCWQLQAHFISNLVMNFTSTYGVDNFRLYLSTFSCLAQTPIYNVLSWNGNRKEGLTDAGSLQQITETLARFENMPQKRMQGTCPSKGANKIYNVMENVKSTWPVSYFVVTDGRVNYPDRASFGKAVTRIKRQLKPSGLRVCAATVGFVNANQIYKDMSTTCVFNAATFIEIAQKKFANDFQTMLLKTAADEDDGVIVYEPPVTVVDGGGSVDDDDDDPLYPPPTNGGGGGGDGQAAESAEDTSVVVGILAASLAVIGMVALFAVRARRQNQQQQQRVKAIDRSRSEAMVSWLDNPMRAQQSDADAYAPGASRRRSSQASLEDDGSNLPVGPLAVMAATRKPAASSSRQLANFMGVADEEEFNFGSPERPSSRHAGGDGGAAVKTLDFKTGHKRRFDQADDDDAF